MIALCPYNICRRTILMGLKKYWLFKMISLPISHCAARRSVSTAKESAAVPLKIRYCKALLAISFLLPAVDYVSSVSKIFFMAAHYCHLLAIKYIREFKRHIHQHD